MKMSPMQKYAMRLSETAAEQLRRFGGVQAILRNTVLPQRSSSAGESRLPVSKSIPFSPKKSELER